MGKENVCMQTISISQMSNIIFSSITVNAEVPGLEMFVTL